MRIGSAATINVILCGLARPVTGSFDPAAVELIKLVGLAPYLDSAEHPRAAEIAERALSRLLRAAAGRFEA